VRFNVAKAFAGLMPLLNPTVAEQEVQPCLGALKLDPDADVRFYAGEAFRGKEPRLNLGPLSIPSTPTILRVGSLPSTPATGSMPSTPLDLSFASSLPSSPVNFHFAAASPGSPTHVAKFHHDLPSPSKFRFEEGPPSTPPRLNPKLRPG